MNRISDLHFQLNKEEVQSLISQSAISKMGWGSPCYCHQTNQTNEELDRVLGRKATGKLERGTPLDESHVG